LIDLEDARKQILARIKPIGTEMVLLEDAVGRIIAESVATRDPIPPFDNTAMDGFVLKARDTDGATPDRPVTLPVVATIEAGMAPANPLKDHCAMKIFTGAVIPQGGDTIIPFERCLHHDEQSVVIDRPIHPGVHIRRLGEDVEADGSVMAPGSRITPGAIGLLASVGAVQVPVNRRPRVAIHSSGNELVAIDSALKPGQIRNSNLYSLQARVKRWGAIPIPRPILRDDLKEIRSGLQETLELKPDAIVTTGGISAGDLDHIREVAREMGDDVQIRKVAMKPGKPLVDGLIGGVPFFGLPGNPAACLVSFEIFVRPALAKMEGRTDGILPERCGVLKSERSVPASDRLRLLRGRATADPDGGADLIEIPSGQGSHLLSGFAGSNCLVVAPPSTDVLRPGDRVNYWSLTDEEA